MSGIDSMAVSIIVDILVEFVNSINITTYIETAALSSQGHCPCHSTDGREREKKIYFQLSL